MSLVIGLTENAAAARARIERHFTQDGVHPYDAVEWEIRDAVIPGERGPVFEQKGVEVPKAWSQTATNVVVSKYFRGKLGTPARETSVRQMIDRVVRAIVEHGTAHGYFLDAEEALVFEHELIYALVNQLGTFNSPVWFNVGVPGRDPQASACFILSVEDDMESILEWFRNEGRIFKGGSGSGINLSHIRSSREQLSGGGYASGPVSFMRGADSVAGSIKSGGTTRRAAKMVVLNADHPDVRDFIWCKAKEEKKAWALGEAGYDMGLNGEAWQSIQFQNANNSVRVSDDFMHAALTDGEWSLLGARGEVVETTKARALLREIAQATWECGDPGMQFDDACNHWHTRIDTERNYATNPCSEFVSINNSACNLASINLLKHANEAYDLDTERFRQTVRLFITAQEILVGLSSYPTEGITKNARAHRELGLGYANLGALLMARGLPYDSDEGRAYAAATTALMTGEAYAWSAHLAERVGPYSAYDANRSGHLRVVRQHQQALDKVNARLVPAPLLDAAKASWASALSGGLAHGYRNSQVTVLAPTGTISFKLDCDTTGIEPDIALVKYKKLVGGGTLKLVNQVVPVALERLGYEAAQRSDILAHIEATGTVEGAPHLASAHYAIFDCAFKAPSGTRSISWLGHVKMMGEVQPFLSGAISKTVNLPETATVEDVEQAYIEAWRRGVKAVAIYRDGSKKVQPLSTSDKGANERKKMVIEPYRRRLPETRQSVTHKFAVGGHEGYLTVGLFEDGTPGEVFLQMAKEGSTVGGLVDAWATSLSLNLQHGVQLFDLVAKFMNQSFEPSGWTGNSDIGMAKSIVDYVVRWIGLRFLGADEKAALGLVREVPGEETVAPSAPAAPALKAAASSTPDAPPCRDCGSLTVRNGTCFKCPNCGGTSGCS